MKRFLAAREPFLNERKSHTILLLRAVKKRADMAMFAERRVGKPHRLVVLSARFSVVLGGIHGVLLSWLKIYTSKGFRKCALGDFTHEAQHRQLEITRSKASEPLT